jgi:hypothetical protein
MSTITSLPSPVRTAEDLPMGAVRVRPGGLLASVHRPCPDHVGPESSCVGRHTDKGCLVFWCEQGSHHFTAR